MTVSEEQITEALKWADTAPGLVCHSNTLAAAYRSLKAENQRLRELGINDSGLHEHCKKDLAASEQRYMDWNVVFEDQEKKLKAAKAENKTWEETVAIWKDSAKILEGKLIETQGQRDAALKDCKTWEETDAIWKDSAKILEAKLDRAMKVVEAANKFVNDIESDDEGEARYDMGFLKLLCVALAAFDANDAGGKEKR